MSLTRPLAVVSDTVSKLTEHGVVCLDLENNHKQSIFRGERKKNDKKIHLGLEPLTPVGRAAIWPRENSALIGMRDSKVD